MLALRIPQPQIPLCHNNDKGTWPHLPSLCKHKFLKGLWIARHDVSTQQITNLLESNSHTRHYTLTKVGNKAKRSQDYTIPLWFLPCTSHTIKCTCLARLCPNIMYIRGATQEQTGPFPLAPNLAIRINRIYIHAWHMHGPSHQNQTRHIQPLYFNNRRTRMDSSPLNLSKIPWKTSITLALNTKPTSY